MAELRDAVKKFSSDLAEKVESFIADVEMLEVNTYTTAADGNETLRAHTSVSFDGDTTVKVPIGEGSEVSIALWELHQSIVQQAMANRAAMIQSLGEAAASALKALGIAGE
jgi:hypothetical protein